MSVTFFIKTYGCQANEADSYGLSQYLYNLGCSQVFCEQSANIIIINTCAIRDNAEQKLFSYIGTLKNYKKLKSSLCIVIIGCVASYRKQEIYERFDHISFVHGAREDISLLQAYLADTVNTLFTVNQHTEINFKQTRDISNYISKKNLLDKTPGLIINKNISELNLFIKNKLTKNNQTTGNISSLINIMTGCNKYCSYCIVPFTRGREISYPASEILNKVRTEIASGAKEVILLGQNVNSYQDPETKIKFHELLEQVAQIDGEFWVRFFSPHPRDLTKELFYIMKKHRLKLTACIHFPLQSGSNKILALMNRDYTREEYLEKINWIREILPEATISTDIIVGFPGETDQEFLETLDIMEKVHFDMIYSFVYSPRKYTKAFNLSDTYPQEKKYKNLEELQKRHRDIAIKQNSLKINTIQKVLVEKQLPHGKLLAKTEGNIRVIFAGDPSLIGQFVPVYIDKVTVTYLDGHLVKEKW
jgi:tRNA-2-methylthio-N6-dimethylallyladenosine synthase